MTTSGFLDGPHGRVWFETHNADAAGTPLLVVHGGPGFGHSYLEVLDRLGDERPVVYYDQIGCGRSDRPDDPGLWTVDTFAEEIGFVRSELGLDEVHLHGHSIGPAYVVLHALAGADGIRSLVLQSPFLSGLRWNSDQETLRHELPERVLTVLEECEASGETRTHVYQDAVDIFNRRFWCRVDPVPQVLQNAAAQMNRQMVRTMYGGDPFQVRGNLKYVELIDRLGDVDVPALVTCGSFDQISPATGRVVTDALPKAEMAVFEESGHMAHLTEPDRFVEVVGGFLARV